MPFLLPTAAALTCRLLSELILMFLGRLLCSSSEFGHMLFVKQVTCLIIEQKDDLVLWTLKSGLDSDPGSEVT